MNIILNPFSFILTSAAAACSASRAGLAQNATGATAAAATATSTLGYGSRHRQGPLELSSRASSEFACTHIRPRSGCRRCPPRTLPRASGCCRALRDQPTPMTSRSLHPLSPPQISTRQTLCAVMRRSRRQRRYCCPVGSREDRGVGGHWREYNFISSAPSVAIAAAPPAFFSSSAFGHYIHYE